MRFIRRSDERNQRAADRAEQKRRQSPAEREARSPRGERFSLVGYRRGYPLPERYLAEAFTWTGLSPSLALVVEARRWLLHTFRHRKSWVVNVAQLDTQGFQTGETREIVAESESGAVATIAEVSLLLEKAGLPGLYTEIANGRFRTTRQYPS